MCLVLFCSAGVKSMERPPAELPSSDDDPPPPAPVPEAMEAMWGMEAAGGGECDCGPPPEFLLPPPPRPPILQPDNPLYCTEDPLPIETCDALPVSTKKLYIHVINKNEKKYKNLKKKV